MGVFRETRAVRAAFPIPAVPPTKIAKRGVLASLICAFEALISGRDTIVRDGLRKLCLEKKADKMLPSCWRTKAQPYSYSDYDEAYVSSSGAGRHEEYVLPDRTGRTGVNGRQR